MIYKFVRSSLSKIFNEHFLKRDKSIAERYPHYEIGVGTYGDLNVFSWGEGARLRIGNYTSIASGVKIFLGGEHRMDWVTTFPFNVLWESAWEHTGHPKTKGDVIVGNDVWIGTEALISSGVRVGDGAVIGARAVVTRDVPPYAVVVGNPAKVVKYRFDQITIERFLALKWWNWPRSEIERAIPEMLNDEVEIFIKKAEHGDYK